MNFDEQKVLTIVSDIKFVLTRLDEAKHEALIKLLIEQIDKFENVPDPADTKELIETSIEEINNCMIENKISHLQEIDDLIDSFKGFLPK